MSKYTLEDGSQAVVTANGEVISGCAGVSMWQEYDEDGNVVTYYEDEQSRAYVQDRHHAAVSTFRKSNQYRRVVRRLAPRAVQAPRRSASCSGRPRARRTGASSTTSGIDPGSEADQLGEPPLRLAPSRAVFTFGVLTAEQRGEQVSS